MKKVWYKRRSKEKGVLFNMINRLVKKCWHMFGFAGKTDGGVNY